MRNREAEIVEDDVVVKRQADIVELDGVRIRHYPPLYPVDSRVSRSINVRSYHMPQYLLSVYQPDGPPPPASTLNAIMKKVETVRLEMHAAGALVLTAGLEPPSSAAVVRPKPGGALVTDGPFAETKEVLGGFTIVEAADREAALGWARKLASATTLPIEIRALSQYGSHV